MRLDRQRIGSLSQDVSDTMQLHANLRAAAAAIGVALALSSSGVVRAADCGNDGGGFESWLGRFKSHAAAQGVSAGTMATAFADVSYDRNVIRLDRSQHSFKLSFEQFYARRVSPSLISRGRRMLDTHRALFDRIEKRFGVPGAVLVSIWGLETNYGNENGRYSIVRSLATLAYDCRRSDFFRNELLSALKIIQRGDMSAGQLRGGWAGEIGPMQFLTSSYYKYAVDFDGDGRRDLIHSVPDMLASTANYLKAYGWKAGQGWGQGTANYAVLREWNKAEVYVQTIAVMAERMSGRS
jgi:lytic murein transglycosylase